MRFGELRKSLGIPVLLNRRASKGQRAKAMDEETCVQKFYAEKIPPYHSGIPLAGVRIQLPEFNKECYTGEDGFCSISGLPYYVSTQVIATKEGYAKSTGYIVTCEEPTVMVHMGEEGCFIATAAYGTPLHEDINILREFRDEHLLTNPFGRIFTKTYYTLSPPFANLISKSEILRAAVRKALIAPVVRYLRRKRK